MENRQLPHSSTSYFMISKLQLSLMSIGIFLNFNERKKWLIIKINNILKIRLEWRYIIQSQSISKDKYRWKHHEEINSFIFCCLQKSVIRLFIHSFIFPFITYCLNVSNVPATASLNLCFLISFLLSCRTVIVYTTLYLSSVSVYLYTCDQAQTL